MRTPPTWLSVVQQPLSQHPPVHQLQAIFPITDLTVSPDELLSEALVQLPGVAARAHARIVGVPRWRVVPGQRQPGSGGASWVLVITAPAEQVPARGYHAAGKGCAA